MGPPCPFLGRFQAWRAPGRLGTRNRPRERRDAGERVRWQAPSRPTFLDAVASRRVARPGLADQRPTINCRPSTTGRSQSRGLRPRADRVPPLRAATRPALLSACRAAEPAKAYPGSAISLLNSRDLPTCYFAGVAETQLQLPIPHPFSTRDLARADQSLPWVVKREAAHSRRVRAGCRWGVDRAPNRARPSDGKQLI